MNALERYKSRIAHAEANGWQRCYPYASVGIHKPAWFNPARPGCGYIYHPRDLPRIRAKKA